MTKATERNGSLTDREAKEHVRQARQPHLRLGVKGAVLVQWQATRHTALNATYSHFFTGPFFGFAGLRNDVDFVGLWVNYAL
jgi:hypothetical protein